jgi:1,4-dihydroxy-2-naphthoyl-CoA synthase
MAERGDAHLRAGRHTILGQDFLITMIHMIHMHSMIDMVYMIVIACIIGWRVGGQCSMVIHVVCMIDMIVMR